MDPMVTSIISKALDGLSMRYQAIAQNIANATSPNYRPVRVDFENDLRRAAEAGPDAVRHLALTMRQDTGHVLGSEIRLDLEIAEAAQTSMRYAALIDMLGRRMAINRAITGGGQ